ncbi:MAG: hypothetical protein NT027_10735 [Proteobacteria bacterium]|nr:hypothetical protein [Pseudomonadota bacterium]
MKSFMLTMFLPLLLTTPGFAGHDRGNTADLGRPDENSAWFLDSRKVVKYCIDIHNESGTNLEQVKAAIEKSLSTWQSYILERKVHKDEPTHLQLTTKFILDPSTSCSDKTDLKFLIGHPRDQDPIRPILDNQLHWNPLGLAQRTEYSVYNGWGKGFIWIAPAGSVFSGQYFPSWKVENALSGVLLHELGHVFGNGHIQDTIMDSQTLHANLLTATMGRGQEQADAISNLSRIDLKREITSIESRDFTQIGFTYRIEAYKPRALAIFKDIMDRDPIGDPVASLQRRNYEYYLRIADTTGSHEFLLEQNKQEGGYNPVSFDSERAFKIYGPRTVASGSFMGVSLHSSSMTVLARITKIGGTKNQILIKRSMGSRLWEIDYINDEGTVKNIFSSKD